MFNLVTHSYKNDLWGSFEMREMRRMMWRVILNKILSVVSCCWWHFKIYRDLLNRKQIIANLLSYFLSFERTNKATWKIDQNFKLHFRFSSKTSLKCMCVGLTQTYHSLEHIQFIQKKLQNEIELWYRKADGLDKANCPNEIFFEKYYSLSQMWWWLISI